MQAISITILAPQTTAHDNKDEHRSTLAYANGDSYEGDFIGGLREGEGIYTFAGGDVFDGNFEAGNFQGKGKYTTEQGDVYEGNFITGQASGFGSIEFLTRDDVTEYTGLWLNGRANGKGEIKFASEDTYKGLLQDGLFHGKGVLAYKNGDAYDGEYAAGIPTGKGKMLFASSKIVMNRNLQNGVDRANTKELKDNTFSLNKKKKDNVTVHANTFRQGPSGNANPNAGIMGSILGNLGINSAKQHAKTNATAGVKKTSVKAGTEMAEEKTNKPRTSVKTATAVVVKKANAFTTTKKLTSAKKTVVAKVKSSNATKAVKKATKAVSKSKSAPKIKKAIKKVAPKKVATKKIVRTVVTTAKPTKLEKIKKLRKARASAAPDFTYAAVARPNINGLSRRKREGIKLDGLFDSAQSDQKIRRSISMIKTIQQAQQYLEYKYGDEMASEE